VPASRFSNCQSGSEDHRRDRRFVGVQIRRIVEGEDMPRTGERQTLLFSATFPKVTFRAPLFGLTQGTFPEVKHAEHCPPEHR
jgi:hypothetical protein